MEEVEKIRSIMPISHGGKTYLRILVNDDEMILYEVDPIRFAKYLLEAYREILN